MIIAVGTTETRGTAVQTITFDFNGLKMTYVKRIKNGRWAITGSCPILGLIDASKTFKTKKELTEYVTKQVDYWVRGLLSNDWKKANLLEI